LQKKYHFGTTACELRAGRASARRPPLIQAPPRSDQPRVHHLYHQRAAVALSRRRGRPLWPPRHARAGLLVRPHHRAHHSPLVEVRERSAARAPASAPVQPLTPRQRARGGAHCARRPRRRLLDLRGGALARRGLRGARKHARHGVRAGDLGAELGTHALGPRGRRAH
jgi:hypothetical protein